MTDKYVRSGAPSSPHDGSDWAHAYVTLLGATNVVAAGDRIFVAEDHSESQATAMAITLPGTPTNPNYIFCVDHNGTVPPVAADLRTTAVVGVTGNVALTLNGSFECYGVTFNGGSTTGTTASILLAQAAGNRQLYRNCAFALRNGSVVYLMAGASSGTTAIQVDFEGTTVTFGTNAGQGLMVNGIFNWRNTASAASWGTQPTYLLIGAAGRPYQVFLEGVDISNYTGTIIGIGAGVVANAVVKDCKTNASATLAVGAATTFPIPITDWIRTDSGNTNYKQFRTTFDGTLFPETTTVRTAGAGAPNTDGVTTESWKIVTTGNASPAFPFICPPIRIWNDVVSGTISLTMYGTASAVPYNDELIFEAEVLGDASYPLGSKVTSEMTPLGTHAALDTDSVSTWGGSALNPFYKTLTLSPRQKGYIYIYIKAAKASTTYYVDPRPVIASAPAVSRSSLGHNELFAGIARSRIGIGM